jgi:hypothetical protein
MTHRHGKMALNNPRVLIMKNVITLVLCFITLPLTALKVAAQTQVVSGSRGTSTIISPNGITTIMPMGSRGYTVMSPEGITNVMSYGSGNYTIVSPRGTTSVLSNGSRGYTVIGPEGVTSVLNTGSDGDSEALISVDGQLLLMGR